MIRKTSILAIFVAVALLGVMLSSHRARAYGSTVTGYLPTGYAMAHGEMPFYGAASCSYAYPMGTQIEFWDGFVVTCLDRGALDAYGVDIDIFVCCSVQDAYNVQARYSGTDYFVIRWGFSG